MEEDEIYNIERAFIGLKFNTTVYKFSNKIGELEGKIQKISNKNLRTLIGLLEQNIEIIDDILKEEK